MNLAHIAELTPELQARDAKQFKAAVTLIWPWSSSQRQFALLLAEPDFRLRRKKGQVRARFSGSSAKALATTGVGIGDEVILSLRGAQFVQEGTASTPGRSIDWELEYTQTVAVQVFRDGKEIANLDMVDAAPTPALRSPVRRQTNTVPSPMQQWSSPAFIKRARLSDGPFFEAPYDPLADENAEGHDKKRRRKSYRDWKAWTYNARTPSPEKSDAGTEDDFNNLDASPSRRAQLPHTPISPPKRRLPSVAAGQLDGAGDVTQEQAQDLKNAISLNVVDALGNKSLRLPNARESLRDNDNHDLYAGLDEDLAADAQFAFGGDTEANTEDEELEDTDAASMSPTEADTEEVEEFHPSEIEESDVVAGTIDAGSTTEEGQFFEPPASQDRAKVVIEDAEPVPFDQPADSHTIIMPPPTLPTLDTNFQTTHVPGMLTPVGEEPSSPKLQPLDSALLPLPSPFPGERDINITSYLDHNATNHVPEQPQEEVEEPPSDASYILENSFFSSINSTKATGFHPDHESSFTPVRFTFGMDGAGHSRQLDLSSPAPELAKENAKIKTHLFGMEETPIESHTVPETIPVGPLADDWESVHHGELGLLAPIGHQEFAPGPETHDKSKEQENLPALSDAFETKEPTPEVIELSSDSEEEEGSEESEVHEDTEVGERVIEESVHDGVEHLPDDSRSLQDPLDSHLSQDDYGLATTNRFAAVTDIVDLGPPSGSSAVEETVSHGPYQDPRDESKSVATSTKVSARSRDPNTLLADQSFESRQIQSPSELIAMDFAPVNLDFPANRPSEESTQNRPQQGTQDITDLNIDNHSWLTENVDALQTVETADTVMHDSFAQDENFDLGTWVTEDVDDHHPDVKVESIEEGSIFQYSELDTEHRNDDDIEAGPSEKILIEVPEEGHKVGELHTISVPATGPARNTRSKTKTSTSPTKSEMSPVKRTTRSTRSKASATPVALTFDSPPKTRTRFTMSPSQDGSQTSPYSLRSQSKLLSPAQSTFVIGTATRRSPRKHVSQRSVDSVSDVGQSQSQDVDPFMTSFKPSQELGASQGRYSEVGFVKDSEEESLHSEHSLSTVRYSDDWNAFTNFSDPHAEPARDYDLENLKPPPASAPNASIRGTSRRRGAGDEQQTVLSNRSSPKDERSPLTKQSPSSSPTRRLRSAASTEVDFTSPRSLRASRRSTRLSSSPAQRPEEFSDEATPKAQGVAYPPLPGENEVVDLRSSPTAQAVADEIMRSSPPAAATHQQSRMAKGKPITPEPTQRTNMESQNDSVAGQQQQSLLMTPQLTQTTSAGFKSFNESMGEETTVVATPTKGSPNVVTRSTPRRNANQTDVASPSTTPKEHSPDISSDLDATAVEKSEGPSIGLSTPLAYYTPLDSLTYFLNRSSQFHTSSNPDVLALVTQGTTAPQRATKGRKDWTTTLHITDASSWPATTTVSIFRPYQSALPAADAGDIVLLRAFAVKSLNRHPTLTSADESSWCVWRYIKPVWGAKRGAFGELRAREEVKGPLVERGEGEWREVEKLRDWWVGKIKGELDGMVGTHTRSHDKKENAQEVEGQGVKTRSRDAATREG